MNREIKFRIWLENAKRMVYSNSLKCIYDDGGCDQHLALCLVCELEENFYNNSHEIDLNGNRFIQQSTGLFDKNKKEIYEGDICERPNWDSLWIVYYYLDGFFWRGVRENDRDFLTFRAELADGEDRLSYSYKDCEIVGNVFENPELLQ